MEWKTQVTEMLGCQYPIIQGALHGFGNSQLAAPVSEAGGFGIITASACRSPQGLREEIRKCKDMTDKPFGVNVSMGLCPRPEKMIEVAVDEGIKVVETAAFRSVEYGKQLHQAGLRWIHKVTNMKHALAAEKDGADAVVVVGLEGIGFKGKEQLPSLIAISLAAKQLKLPVIAAGGFGDAGTFLAGLAMGAEAVYMATVFMATKECPVPDSYKQRLIESRAWAPDYLGRALYQPKPEELAELEVRKRAKEIPPEKWLNYLEKVREGYGVSAGTSLDSVESMLKFATGSLAVAFIDRVMTVKELIDNIIQGAEDILANWGVTK
jgi:NAD(P)H-dependent flavin oxidoreductase YrpB (nitropropane dioxygenase family)